VIQGGPIYSENGGEPLISHVHSLADGNTGKQWGPAAYSVHKATGYTFDTSGGFQPVNKIFKLTINL